MWAFKLGGTSNDAASSVATDSLGNVYVSGWFRGVIDFDPSADTAFLISHGDNGEDRGFGGDAFLAKYTKDGKYVWALNIGSSDILDAGGEIKIDFNGDILWTGTYTGTNVDFDPSRNVHSLSCKGTTEPYLAKYSAGGQYIWAAGFGGSTVRSSAGRSIAVDKAGNIFLTGHFDGSIDLNPDNAASNYFTSNGCADIFVVKLDRSGKYIWGFNVGGGDCDYVWSMGMDSTNNIYLTGYFSSYNIDFNPGVATNYMSAVGGSDCFVVKYDQNANYIFSNSFGSYGTDQAFDIAVTPKGYTLCGGFSGTVDFDPGPDTYNLTSAGGTDIFLATFNLNGQFEKSFRTGSSLDDMSRSVSVTGDDEVSLIGYFQNSNVDIDPTPSKLLLSSRGGYDFFVAEYAELGLVNTLKGIVFIDKNSNGTKDSSEVPFNYAKVISTKPNVDTIVTITSNGTFSLAIDTGTYVTKVLPYLPYYSVNPISKTTSFSTYKNTDSVLFALQPVPGKKDLAIALLPLTPVRPGFAMQYKLIYVNAGTDTIAAGSVKVIKNSLLTVSSSMPTYSSMVADTISWNFTNFKPWDTASILINFKVPAPPKVNNGDTIRAVATIYPVQADLTPANNTASILQQVVGSYDPNDKTESHGGSLKKSELANADFLQYTIRFQNIGTDTAFNVNVKDTLNAKLDWSTFEMVSASHNYSMTINDGNKCTWLFDNINLPDSLKNEPASHGYIVFRIKPKSTLASGDTVKNTVGIYFDYNPPVQTNTANTVLESATLPIELVSFDATKSGRQNLLQWKTLNQINTDYFDVEKSEDGRNFTFLSKVHINSSLSQENSYSSADLHPSAVINYYRIKIVDKDGKVQYSNIRKINNGLTFDVSIYPNPVKNDLTVKLNSQLETSVQVEIANVEGKVILSRQFTVNSGSAIKHFDLSLLNSGNYFINFKTTSKVQTSIKFQKL